MKHSDPERIAPKLLGELPASLFDPDYPAA
jgi:hypothetical protein